MAGLAKTHQVVIIISPACGNVNDVMNLGGGNKTAVLKAPFAERMLGDIELPNLPPAAAKTFVSVRITFEAAFIIIPVSCTGVLITEVSGGKVRAAGVRTSLLGLIWHRVLLSGRG